MIALRLMVRFSDKNNIKIVQCSRKDDALLNIITDDYVPIEKLSKIGIISLSE